MSNNNSDKQGGGIADLMGEVASLHDLMRGTKEKAGCIQLSLLQRHLRASGSVMPGAHWDPSKARHRGLSGSGRQQCQCQCPRP